jgi:hypothetical protein
VNICSEFHGIHIIAFASSVRQMLLNAAEGFADYDVVTVVVRGVVSYFLNWMYFFPP